MERKNQISFSAILMFVGILFIVIAGGIFVSTTWRYLPEPVKKTALAAVTASLFAGSYFARSRWGLKKTATALYYLGTCFTGFTTLSVFSSPWSNTSVTLSLAMLSMSVPVILRFLQKKHWVDSLFELLLLDGITCCMLDYPLEDSPYIFILTASVVTLLLTLFVKYCRESLPEEKGMPIGALIAFGFHVAILLPLLFFAACESTNFLFTVLPAAIITAAFSVLYLTYRNTLLRVFQSIMISGLNFITVLFFLQNFGEELLESYNDTVIFFVFFVVNLILMSVLDRKELFLLSGGIAALASLVQISSYAISYMLHNYESVEEMIYFPYAFCLIVALAAWKYFKKPSMPWKFLLRYLCITALMEINTLLSFLNATYSTDYSIMFWFALLCLQIAFFCRTSKILRPLFETFALAIAVFAVQTESIIPTVFYGEDGTTRILDLGFEYVSVFAGLGIVLLGYIWYDYKKGIRIFQQIATCLLLAFLLCGNLAMQQLPNVLILGTSMLIMLVVSSIRKQKTYAIASAITLTLIVLYLTRAFWLSITWWVYLFAAGVGLVIFAVKREHDEKKIA